MQVVLLQNLPGVGRIDQVVEVADGYARNYLFAKNLAMPASQSLLRELEAKQAKNAREAEKDLREQQALAAKLDGWEMDIKQKASENGSLFAAISPRQICERLRQAGFNVEEKQIVFKAIKKVGEYPVKIKFRHGLEAEIRVTVYAL